ncbi:hypothetical protein [Xanthomonas sp. SS]|uniref:hypothetical protein n=1 Tax=Xanthomonas sp. SS TaxID=2724122 RepID=UPI001C8CF76C|nr:hypothetical protein [Xanthomonas sp. SS]
MFICSMDSRGNRANIETRSENKSCSASVWQRAERHAGAEIRLKSTCFRWIYACFADSEKLDGAARHSKMDLSVFDYLALKVIAAH